jgi:hypothetical protein
VALWAGLVFYLRLSWICHWCAVRSLENFDDGAPCVAQVTTEDTSIHLTLMMMTEMDIKTSVYYIHLTQLIAREDFIKFTRHESTKTYTVEISSLQYLNRCNIIIYFLTFIDKKATSCEFPCSYTVIYKHRISS